ncbi:MAG: sigma-70 family RNA polymerase sigma factor [Oscillospiraceae bacterium]|nr:sigma-70 family RNA polymerase sigma factor [Oscillospiraceae bacterium]
MADSELVFIALSDERAYSELISRFLPTVRRLARVYALNPNDQDDLFSEGLLGLMNSVKTYNSDKKASFSTYASVCISNRMINAIKKSDRILKREENLDDSVASSDSSPESILIERESVSELVDGLQYLSTLERDVFLLYIHGESYQKIAEVLNTSPKSVDNALRRVRTKLRKKLG